MRASILLLLSSGFLSGVYGDGSKKNVGFWRHYCNRTPVEKHLGRLGQPRPFELALDAQVPRYNSYDFNSAS